MVQMGEVTALNVFPVKGMRGVPSEEALVETRGLRGDRRWIVTDHEGVFLTQRNEPSLATFDAHLVGEHLMIKHVECGLAMIPVPKRNERPVVVWRDTVEARDAGIMATQWISKALNRPARLFYMPEASKRPTDPQFSELGDHVSFADGFPVLVTNTASLKDLNSKMAEAVGMDRFRSNIVVTGFESYEEDGWRRLSIGGVNFRAVKPCGRCIVTTTDQRTGERKGNEPLTTLASSHLIGQAAVFGMNLIPESGGVIRVGDPVSILATSEP